ncbi:hypothetical protein CYLTODRAFT_459068 [Cylindrobasidium torrendii FP15055 ss-10]|uniref:F-box domain-containing protein n=1 Tax=Cylindrobasidium torrendii FP15055 ss-10 TaxID=1314674 RepID=A0A0D7AVC9_9AGAR|nr:hypothetical protein CYLTODRAFT_459068 [Cylindrobasidium torrendii FP15055 ss-10]
MSSASNTAFCQNCGHGRLAPPLHSPFDALIAAGQQIKAEDSTMNDTFSAFMEEVRTDIEWNRKLVRRLRETVVRAERELERLETIMDTHLTINPPIHKLPMEVLGRIFEYSFTRPFELFPPDYTWSTLQAGSSFGPRTLATVCKRWHGVTVGTSRLWNGFNAEYRVREPKAKASADPSSTEVTESEQKKALITKNAFKYSKTAPLDITLWSACPDWYHDQVLSNVHRVERVHAVLQFPCKPQLIALKKYTNWPKLKTLELNAWPHVIRNKFSQRLMDFQDAPNLRELVLTTADLFRIEALLFAVPLPLLQITSLSITLPQSYQKCHPQDFGYLVSRLPNLRTLSVPGIIHFDTNARPSKPVYDLKKLHEISIDAPCLLQHIRCPELRDFTTSKLVLAQPVTLNFLKRSSTNLTRVTTPFASVYEPDCSKALEMVTDLEVTLDPIALAMKRLDPDKSRLDSVAPMVQTLKITCEHNFESRFSMSRDMHYCLDESLAEFIKQRWNVVAGASLNRSKLQQLDLLMKDWPCFIICNQLLGLS